MISDLRDGCSFRVRMSAIRFFLFFGTSCLSRFEPARHTIFSDFWTWRSFLTWRAFRTSPSWPFLVWSEAPRLRRISWAFRSNFSSYFDVRPDDASISYRKSVTKFQDLFQVMVPAKVSKSASSKTLVAFPSALNLFDFFGLTSSSTSWVDINVAPSSNVHSGG